jgi:hypothetical protein
MDCENVGICSYTSIWQSAIVGVLRDTHCRGGLMYEQMVTVYAHDEYLNMLLTFGTRNNQSGANAWSFAGHNLSLSSRR